MSSWYGRLINCRGKIKRAPNRCLKRKLKIKIHCIPLDQHQSTLFEISNYLLSTSAGSAQKAKYRKMNVVTISSVCYKIGIQCIRDVDRPRHVDCGMASHRVVWRRYRFPISCILIANHRRPILISHFKQAIRVVSRGNFDERFTAMKFDFYYLFLKFDQLKFAPFAVLLMARRSQDTWLRAVD